MPRSHKVRETFQLEMWPPLLQNSCKNQLNSLSCQHLFLNLCGLFCCKSTLPSWTTVHIFTNTKLKAIQDEAS